MESITESGVEFTLDWKEWLKLEQEHPAIRLGETLLAEPCARCKATGRSEHNHDWHGNGGDLWSCDCGATAAYFSNHQAPTITAGPCRICDGRGYNMTPAGKELQRFVAVFGSSLFGQPEPAYARTGINNSGGPFGTAGR